MDVLAAVLEPGPGVGELPLQLCGMVLPARLDRTSTRPSE